ncbi:glycosyltransferase family 2 protein [Mucilaginibacter sp. HD30]
MEIQKIKISVILPVFNGEKFLKEAVRSILNQTYTNFELIIIDDCSTDATPDILTQFNSDVRVRVIRNKANLKVVKTLNKGIQLSHGEYIARMDADDISHPERLEKQVAFLESNPTIGICGTWVETFGAENKVMRAAIEHEHIKVRLFFVNPMFHPSIMFRRDVLQANASVYDEQYTNAEDYGLWVRLIDKVKFANIPTVLLKYRIHDTNVSVFKESNKAVLDSIHFNIYSIFLNKLGINFSQRELIMHRKLGMVQVGHLQLLELEEYLIWLKKLTIANNNVAYFDKAHFGNVILSYILYVTKQTSSITQSLKLAYKVLGHLYEINDCANFFISRTKVKLRPVKSF